MIEGVLLLFHEYQIHSTYLKPLRDDGLIEKREKIREFRLTKMGYQALKELSYLLNNKNSNNAH